MSDAVLTVIWFLPSTTNGIFLGYAVVVGPVAWLLSVRFTARIRTDARRPPFLPCELREGRHTSACPIRSTGDIKLCPSDAGTHGRNALPSPAGSPLRQFRSSNRT